MQYLPKTMTLLSALLLLLCMVSSTLAKSCDTSNCMVLNGKPAMYCPDGTPLGGSTFCGVGKCNIFGYNCDGGCREGDFPGLQTCKNAGVKSGCCSSAGHVSRRRSA